MNEIIHGDFRDFDIPQDAFIISDPPYNQDYHYTEYKDSLPRDEYSEMLFKAFGNRKCVIISYPEETVNILGKILGEVEQVVSWVYNSNTAKQSRLVSWWNCKPNMTKIPQAYKNPTDKRIAKRISEGKSARSYDWWEINQVKNVSKKDNPHPCPIPDELARRIILSTTEENDLIVDPFAGSGTICRIAKELNRRFIGYEIDKTYAGYANKTI